jgi:hypothetical protein
MTKGRFNGIAQVLNLMTLLLFFTLFGSRRERGVTRVTEGELKGLEGRKEGALLKKKVRESGREREGRAKQVMLFYVCRIKQEGKPLTAGQVTSLGGQEVNPAVNLG